MILDNPIRAARQIDIMRDLCRRAYAEPEINEKPCPECGDPVRGTKRKIHCSTTCTQRAAYRNRQERRKEEREEKWLADERSRRIIESFAGVRG